MSAIYKRELRSYFSSMIGYVFIAVIMVFVGLFFTAVNLRSGAPYFSYAMINMIIIFVIAVPILTMKCMAEERKSKTDQMLLTYPVKVSSIIIGKFFAMMTVYAIPLLISCICPIIINAGGNGSLVVDYTTIFAFLCMGFMFVSIGMFVSSLTESQIIAAVGTMGMLMLVYFWPNLISFIPATAFASFIGLIAIAAVVLLILYHVTKSPLITIIVGVICVAALVVTYLVNSTFFASLLPNMLNTFSTNEVIRNFANYAVFDFQGLLKYLSIAALFIFLTIQTVQKRRWS